MFVRLKTRNNIFNTIFSIISYNKKIFLKNQTLFNISQIENLVIIIP